MGFMERLRQGLKQAAQKGIDEPGAGPVVDLGAIACRLIGREIGLELLAILPEHDQKQAYVLRDESTLEYYVLVIEDKREMVSLLDQKGWLPALQRILNGEAKPRIIWDNEYDRGGLNAQTVFESFYPVTKGWNLRFVSKQEEVETGIERKRFDSTVGPILFHSRHVPGGTENMIEIPRQNVFIRTTWDANTHAHQITGQLDSLPF